MLRPPPPLLLPPVVLAMPPLMLPPLPLQRYHLPSPFLPLPLFLPLLLWLLLLLAYLLLHPPTRRALQCQCRGERMEEGGGEAERRRVMPAPWSLALRVLREVLWMPLACLSWRVLQPHQAAKAVGRTSRRHGRRST